MTLFTDTVEQLTCRVGVIGLGYVGLPLAVEFAHRGFKAAGFEVDKTKIDAINLGRSYIGDV
jgi:UDP-N-acetyl-D-glucosamine dehydrogenase